MDDNILNHLTRIEELILEQSILKKEVLNLREAAIYTGQSHSYLYKLTSAGKIPHYKPTGKKLYFNRLELDQWLLRNRIKAHDEIASEATNFQIKEGRSHGTD